MAEVTVVTVELSNGHAAPSPLHSWPQIGLGGEEGGERGKGSAHGEPGTGLWPLFPRGKWLRVVDGQAPLSSLRAAVEAPPAFALDPVQACL